MQHQKYFEARILIIDDEPAKVQLISRLLGNAGYAQLETETDSGKATHTFERFRPDLVVLDLHMSPKDGFVILRELNIVIPEGSYLPILVLTGDITNEARDQALSSGAMDFLAKPFSTSEILLRVRNLLHTRALHLELVRDRDTLEKRVKERTAEVIESQSEILERLAKLAEYRDDTTGKHTKRVAEIVRQVAVDMGFSPEASEMMGRASLLHDIGKVAIPDEILLKQGKLTEEEYDQMKTHTNIGGDILTGSNSDLLSTAESIARYHHEKWDGTGYRGVESKLIPIEARITAIADVFDALMSSRPYKEAWKPAMAMAEVERLSGSHFDPEVVVSFLNIAPNIMGLYKLSDEFRQAANRHQG